MLQPTEVVVSGVAVHLTPLPLFTALKLDKKLVAILAPMTGELVKAFKPGEGVESLLNSDVGALGSAIQKSLESMPDADFVAFLRDMLQCSFAPVEGKGLVALNDESNLAAVFGGNMLGIYQLVLEVAKYNKFLPFALGGIGNAMNLTRT